MKQKMGWIGWLPLCAVGAVLAAVYIAWFAAYSQLGRRPMPSMDDPKDVGGFSAVVYDVMTWVVLASVVVWVAGMIANLVASFLPGTEQRKSWVIKAGCGLAGVLLLFVMLRQSPGDACTWFLD